MQGGWTIRTSSFRSTATHIHSAEVQQHQLALIINS
ncbi:unnamed protein product [Paramecium octaurelia]|uniref:Uncharacterized protein n=1 Tax=Paramecium octaurelia TaxID=43137 RepID=A0A8S1XRM5_PAROT|nr:unnamed protein product [Paramecium octaurelia]